MTQNEKIELALLNDEFKIVEILKSKNINGFEKLDAIKFLLSKVGGYGNKSYEDGGNYELEQYQLELEEELYEDWAYKYLNLINIALENPNETKDQILNKEKAFLIQEKDRLDFLKVDYSGTYNEKINYINKLIEQNDLSLNQSNKNIQNEEINDEFLNLNSQQLTAYLKESDTNQKLILLDQLNLIDHIKNIISNKKYNVKVEEIIAFLISCNKESIRPRLSKIKSKKTYNTTSTNKFNKRWSPLGFDEVDPVAN